MLSFSFCIFPVTCYSKEENLKDVQLFIWPEGDIPEGYHEDDLREDFPGVYPVLKALGLENDNVMENTFEHPLDGKTYREWIDEIRMHGWTFDINHFFPENHDIDEDSVEEFMGYMKSIKDLCDPKKWEDKRNEILEESK